MEGSHGGSSSPAPFLIKTYDMLDEPSTNSIVAWSQSGCSFVVWNPLDFARDLLPVYFKHNNFSSFIRQLNTYGFRKIDPERWEFANDEFIRGQKHLLKNIHRRKPIHSHSTPPPGSYVQAQLSDTERQELKDEIERLKLDKSSLITELERHARHQLDMDRQIQDLEDRLHGMALRQRNLVSFLDQAIQRPGFLSSLIQHSDLQAKKRRLPEDDDCPLRDAAMQERFIAASIPALDIEPFEKMESSLNSLEVFLHDVGVASGEVAFSEDRLPCITTDMHASSSREADLDAQSPICPENNQSCPESAAIPVLDDHPIQPGARSMASDIDMNSEPDLNCVDQRKENVAATAAVGFNDIFWEQFLTESPGYCDAQETELERSAADGRRAEVWNRKSVDHLTERMCHLSSTETT